MAEPKTKVTEQTVTAFIDAVSDEETRNDCRAIVKLMRDVTKSKPKMWGASIIGFGCYHYTYASGREGDWPVVGFSPRKSNFAMYLNCGFARNDEIMQRLGKHKTGKSCLYIKKLSDIDLDVLRELIEYSVKHHAG